MSDSFGNNFLLTAENVEINKKQKKFNNYSRETREKIQSSLCAAMVVATS